MDDLLKEAIADAKAVRETALENAKIALEEAFTPRLQSMLSKKIQSEMDVEEGEHEDDEEKEEAMHDEDDEMEERGAEERMHADEDEDDVEERATDEDEDDMEERMDKDEDEDMDENVIEIDGVKYAPVVAEEEDEDDDMEERMDNKDEDEDMDEDLDLEAVLRELEEEEGDDEDDEPKESVEEEEEKEEGEEVDATTGIGSSDNKTGTADKSSGIGTKDKAKHNESVEITEEEDEDDEKDVDEEIDLEEVIAALTEEEDEEKTTAEVTKLQSDLDEHRNVVKYLRSKLNEVNLLNAKLLFTNKLFRSFGLTNDQKMKVVENFDRAHNLREVKLVYSTLAESFGTKTTKTEIKESKGSASKAVASTKSEKQETEVIAEGSEMRDRFKKLAGIL